MLCCLSLDKVEILEHQIVYICTGIDVSLEYKKLDCANMDFNPTSMVMQNISTSFQLCMLFYICQVIMN